MTRTDKRKHRQQMSDAEADTVLAQVRAFQNVSISHHARQRMRDKGITKAEVSRAIQHGDLIEVHNNVPGELRVLLELVDKSRGRISVVVNFNDGEVKTVWFNNYDDTHATRDWSQYRWTTNLLEQLQAA